jgi:hypothetical protein
MVYAGYPISELPPTDAALSAIAGLAFISIAVFNRKFYWLKGWMSGDKPAPLWFGRIMFGGLGLLFFLIGTYNLLSQ